MFVKVIKNDVLLDQSQIKIEIPFFNFCSICLKSYYMEMKLETLQDQDIHATILTKYIA